MTAPLYRRPPVRRSYFHGALLSVRLAALGERQGPGPLTRAAPQAPPRGVALRAAPAGAGGPHPAKRLHGDQPRRQRPRLAAPGGATGQRPPRRRRDRLLPRRM